MLINLLGLLIVLCACVRLSIAALDSFNNGTLRINKCCEPNEVLVDKSCVLANGTAVWSPMFTGYDGKTNIQVPGFWFAVGVPECEYHVMWPVYADATSQDRLALLPDGKLRHFIKSPEEDDSVAFDEDAAAKSASRSYDYEPGQYCMDKAYATKDMDTPSEFAMICYPESDGSHFRWTESPEYLVVKIVTPICHGISISILFVVAIVYFVFPSLRDLVGNIITTITCCLVTGQVANLMGIFTEFRNHYNFLVLDIISQISMTATFFWLSSLGYFIWKTFRARNVFLRVTDGKKYCWYSFFAWGSTISMGALATVAHVFVDITDESNKHIGERPETIGLLGRTIFFIANCIAIGTSIYFYVSTHNYLSNRLNASFGRIHHKLKSNFIMFSLLLILLTISWILTMISWFEFDGMWYLNLVISAIQAPLVLYICVLRQKHITYLLQKSCCSKQPLTAADWGDEMIYINTAH